VSRASEQKKQPRCRLIAPSWRKRIRHHWRMRCGGPPTTIKGFPKTYHCAIRTIVRFMRCGGGYYLLSAQLSRRYRYPGQKTPDNPSRTNLHPYYHFPSQNSLVQISSRTFPRFLTTFFVDNQARKSDLIKTKRREIRFKI